MLVTYALGVSYVCTVWKPCVPSGPVPCEIPVN